MPESPRQAHHHAGPVEANELAVAGDAHRRILGVVSEQGAQLRLRLQVVWWVDGARASHATKKSKRVVHRKYTQKPNAQGIQARREHDRERPVRFYEGILFVPLRSGLQEVGSSTIPNHLVVRTGRWTTLQEEHEREREKERERERERERDCLVSSEFWAFPENHVAVQQPAAIYRYRMSAFSLLV